MKIKVLQMLRGAKIMANVGDEIIVDTEFGKSLIKAGAAELIEEEIIEIEQPEPAQTQEIIEQTETIELIKEEKKELDIKENKKKGEINWI